VGGIAQLAFQAASEDMLQCLRIHGCCFMSLLVLQLALWEEYADEVEEQMRVLLADNALLQAALADVRSSLAHELPSSAGKLPLHTLCHDLFVGALRNPWCGT
jgi:hypothetical protein